MAAIREIVFDTETTGLDPNSGDRLVEIGCVELLNAIPTGVTFQTYLDPERDMPVEAFRVHGLSSEFLRGKPRFAQKVAEFIAFIGDARLVAHNAEFDMRFVNSELKRLERPTIDMERVTDTLALARRKHPGAQNSLDSLCARYRIDNSRRAGGHGALIDAQILADVYAELLGGRQKSLMLAKTRQDRPSGSQLETRARPEMLAPRLTEAEAARHAEFIAELGEKSVWSRFIVADRPMTPRS